MVTEKTHTARYSGRMVLPEKTSLYIIRSMREKETDRMRKYVIIPDSFKGTLSSLEVCRIVSEKIRELDPESRIVALPAADGGEGTADCFLAAGGWEKVWAEARDPFGSRIRAYYARKGDQAVIEMAQAAGMALAEGKENPALASTYGVGMLIGDAVERGCREIVVGLGGSCTNDGGCGMAAALGTAFSDRAGERFLPTGETLERICRIDITETRKRLKNCRITALCDIDNPMHGPEGAAFVFAPQKGADEEMVRRLDRNLKALDRSIRTELGAEVSAVPGSGAAGAMGAGILAFLGGRLVPGIGKILELVGFDRALEDADLVITGEGRLDSQSVRGKLIAGVAEQASARGVPVAAVVGSAGEGAEQIYEKGVTAIFSINREPLDFSAARGKSAENLAFAAENLIRLCLALGEKRRDKEK